MLSRDFPVRIGLAVLFFLTACGFRGPGRIHRGKDALLAACYPGYQTLLYFSARHHGRRTQNRPPGRNPQRR